MDINRHNYETYFLDYYEKNLNPFQVKELMSFLDINPDLKDEFNEFELISLESDNQVTFPFKQSLKKNERAELLMINDSNYQDYMISFIEGNLSNDEINQLNLFISGNPSKKKELVAFQRTKLVADTSVIYPYKSSLKHYSISYVRVISYAVAAGIMLFFGLFFLLNNNNQTQNNIALTQTERKSVKSVVHSNSEDNISGQVIHNKKDVLAEVKHVKESEIKETNIKQSEVAVISEPLLTKVNALKATELAVNNNDYFPENINPLTIDEVAVNITDAGKNNSDRAASEENSKSIEKLLVAKAYSTVGIESLPTNNKKVKRQKINNFWDVAYIFTKTYNKVFDKDAQLNQSFDNKGNLVAVNFESGLFGFEKKIK